MATIFTIDGEQAVLLPDEYRFDAREVSIRMDGMTGDVILSSRPLGREGLFKALEYADFCEDFLRPENRTDRD